MEFLVLKSNNLFQQVMTEKSLSSVKMVTFFLNIGDNFKFERTLDRNEKSNKLKSHGVVTSMLKGIQKKDWSFGDHPKQD